MGVHRRVRQGNHVSHKGSSPRHYGYREHDWGRSGDVYVRTGRVSRRRPTLF